MCNDGCATGTVATELDTIDSSLCMPDYPNLTLHTLTRIRAEINCLLFLLFRLRRVSFWSVGFGCVGLWRIGFRRVRLRGIGLGFVGFRRVGLGSWRVAAAFFLF